MYRYCKSLAPIVCGHGGRWALRPVVTTPNKNFWGFPRPTDVRIMLRDIDRQMDNFDREMQSFFTNSPIASLLPRSVSLPVVERAGNTYRINIDVSGFKPEDIKLALKDHFLTVEAKMEQKSDGGNRLYQEITRAYTIPEHVDIANLKSLLTTDGILAIEAPLLEQADAKLQEIPINRTEEIASKSV